MIPRKNPADRIGPGGESLAAPRGVSDASRRCKQRPSKQRLGRLQARQAAPVTVFERNQKSGVRCCRSSGCKYPWREQCWLRINCQPSRDLDHMEAHSSPSADRKAAVSFCNS